MTTNVKISGGFSGTGQSSSGFVFGDFNVSISGGVGTVVLERSFDGSTWVDVKTYTAESSERGKEIESDVQYRFNCTVYTSGTISYRLSQNDAN